MVNPLTALHCNSQLTGLRDLCLERCRLDPGAISRLRLAGLERLNLFESTDFTAGDLSGLVEGAPKLRVVAALLVDSFDGGHEALIEGWEARGVTVLSNSRLRCFDAARKLLQPVPDVDLQMAACLTHFAERPTPAEFWRERGGIAALVRLLDAGVVRALGFALRAVYNVAKEFAYGRLFAQEGGIPAVIRLAKCDDVDLQWEAAIALLQLAVIDDCKTLIGRLGGIPALVSLLGSTSDKIPVQAAGALQNLSARNAENKDAIVTEGGIKALVALLPRPDPVLQRRTCAALRNIAAHNAENKDLIAERGGIPPLISCLDSDDESVQKQAVGVLRNLADHEENGLKIAEANGIPAIVRLTEANSEAVQRLAAGALLHLAKNHVAKGVIAECRAIEPLVALLLSDNPSLQKEAVGAIHNLVIDSTENQLSTIRLGGVPALAALLKSEDGIIRQRATNTLKYLAKHRPEEWREVARLVNNVSSRDTANTKPKS